MGWDQFQGRRWDAFHRNAVTVMLSYSFLVWLEWQQRQQVARPGPPRPAFSPWPGYRRRQSLPAVHRHLADWMRLQAIHELVNKDLIDQFCPMRL